MRKIILQKYIELGIDIREAQVCLDANEGVQVDFDGREGDVTIYDVLLCMRDMCKEIGARQAHDYFNDRVVIAEQQDGIVPWERVKPRNWEEIDLLLNIFRRELDNRLFFYMPVEDAEYYQNNKLLSAKARSNFPNLTQELRSAGSAYACGLPTACVFHCMRALEHALGALAVDVGLTWQKEQWHNIIEQIESRITQERKTLPMGNVRDGRLKFLSEAAKEFFYFKDGWRNYVAHNRIAYEGPQALEVLDHVRAFAEKLAPNLKEQ